MAKRFASAICHAPAGIHSVRMRQGGRFGGLVASLQRSRQAQPGRRAGQVVFGQEPPRHGNGLPPKRYGIATALLCQAKRGERDERLGDDRMRVSALRPPQFERLGENRFGRCQSTLGHQRSAERRKHHRSMADGSAAVAAKGQAFAQMLLRIHSIATFQLRNAEIRLIDRARCLRDLFFPSALTGN